MRVKMIAGYNEERRCLGLRPKGAPMDWDFERGFTGAHDILEHHLGVEPIGIIGECWAFGAMLHVRGDGTHFTSEQSMISILSRDLADFCIADDAWELLERPQFAVAPALRAYGDTAYDVPRVLREIAERTTEDVARTLGHTEGRTFVRGNLEGLLVEGYRQARRRYQRAKVDVSGLGYLFRRLMRELDAAINRIESVVEHPEDLEDVDLAGTVVRVNINPRRMAVDVQEEIWRHNDS